MPNFTAGLTGLDLQVELLANGQPTWQSGQLFGLWVNPLTNKMIRIDSFRVFGFSFGKINKLCTH
jgi:hypothetical protein